SRVTMNVLFLHSGGEWLRGSENALLVALRGVRRAGIMPLLWSSNTELLAAAHREGIETIRSSMPEIMIDGKHVRLQFFSWVATIRRIWKLIGRRNIQLLYCNGGSFGQVSSLIERKGIDILLRGFELISRQEPAARLVIVGDGPQRREYELLANKLGIQGRVVFTGNQIDPLPFYQHVFDVNVLASRSDAFPLSLLEASACGLPNLAASVDGIPEAVTDQVTGSLFAAGDHRMLAAKMVSLLPSPGLRRALGEAGRQRAAREFSME